MTVISSREFIANENKYFGMAMTEDVFVKKDDVLFTVSIADQKKEPYMVFEPDDDFYRSISMEEVRDRLHRVIDKLYAN